MSILQQMATDVLSSGFWEIGSYKHNVRRIKEGMEQLDDYSKMIRERAEIEAKYGKMLHQFTEKWTTHVQSNVSNGCVKTAWTNIISEAETLANQHDRVKESLLGQIVQQLTTFRKENYHSNAFRSPKEIREIEDAFEKAQKPWKKLYEKMESSKKDYHSACRQQKSAEVNLANCKADSSISPDGAQKFQERLDRIKETVSTTKQHYEKQLAELTQYRTTYVEAMSFVFEKCQQTEIKRSKFFIDQMSASEKILADLVTSAKLHALHERLQDALQKVDDLALQTDLKQWSNQNGVDAETNWPSFQEYRPEMRTIASKGNPSRDPPSGGVVLTRQIIKTDDIIATPGPANAMAHNGDTGKSSSDSDTNTFDSRKADESSRAKYAENKPWNERVAVDSPPLSNATPDSAKYGDFDDFHGPHTVKSNATVLYDYSPVEDDEIRLHKGDVIELLSDADDLGWCTGRKDGKIGLFPFSYVQVI